MRWTLLVAGCLSVLFTFAQRPKILGQKDLLQFEKTFDEFKMDYYLNSSHINPGDIETMMERGISNLQHGLYDQALASFKKVMHTNFEHHSLYFNTGLCYNMLGESDSAMLYYDKAIVMESSFVPAYIGKGEVLFTWGQLADAKATFNIVLELSEDHPAAHYYLGVMHMIQADMEAARAELEMVPDDDSWTTPKTLRLATVDLMEGNPDLAMNRCNSLLELDTTNRAALEMKYGLHLQREEPKEAMATVNRLVQLDSSDARAQFIRGYLLLLEDQREKGLELIIETMRTADDEFYDKKVLGYRHLELKQLLLDFQVEIHNNSSREWRDYYVAMKYFLTGDFNRTIDMHLLLSKDLDTDFDKRMLIYYLRGKRMLKADNFTLKQLLKSNPDAVNLLLLKAELLVEEEKYDESLQYIGRIMGEFPDHHYALQLRSEVERDQELYEASNNTTMQLMGHYPDYPLGHYRLAYNYRQLGERRKAIVHYKQLMKLVPFQDNFIYDQTARQYQKMDHTDSALIFCNRGIDIFVFDVELRRRRAGIHLEQKSYDLAVEDITYCQAIQPRNGNHYMFKARVLAEQGECKKAFKELDILIQNKIDISSCYYYKGRCKMNTGKYKDAIQYFEWSIKRDSSQYMAYGNLGWIYYLMGNYEESIQWSQACIKKEEDVLFARYNLALAHLRLGQLVESRALYREAKEKNQALERKLSEGAIEDLEALLNDETLGDEARSLIAMLRE